VSQFGGTYTVIVSDKEQNKLEIFADVSSGGGTADTIMTASLKGFSEYAERKAFLEHCNHDTLNSSTGFSAYPRVFHFSHFYINKARNHAYYESFERYAWSEWWRNKKIGAHLLELDQLTTVEKNAVKPLIEQLNTIKIHKKILFIRPFCEKPHQLTIAFSLLSGGGVIAGAAAGRISSIDDNHHVLIHSVVELIRHIQAYQRAKSQNIKPINTYEKQLIFFGNGDGDDIFFNRINSLDGEKITTPQIAFDDEIKCSLSKFFYVHYCKFMTLEPEIYAENELIY
jgi:hypothetical protein